MFAVPDESNCFYMIIEILTETLYDKSTSVSYTHLDVYKRQAQYACKLLMLNNNNSQS